MHFFSFSENSSKLNEVIITQNFELYRCGGEFNLDAGEAEEDGVLIIVDCDTCSLAVEVRLET